MICFLHFDIIDFETLGCRYKFGLQEVNESAKVDFKCSLKEELGMNSLGVMVNLNSNYGLVIRNIR